MTQEPKPRIFISHSSTDRPIVDALVKLLVWSITGLNQTDIHYTSRPATGLPAGTWIQRQLIMDIRSSDYFISVVSESYLTSLYCLWELGVRLGTDDTKVGAVYLPGIEPENLGGVFSDMHLLSLMEENSVQALIEQVASASPHWTHQTTPADMKEFCDKAKSHPPNPIERWRKRLVRLEDGTVFLNAYGLSKKPVRRQLFQDFHPAGANIQPVQYLWSDPRRGNSICAKLEFSATGQSAESFLRVLFNNLPNSLGCNFAVRPLNSEAVLTGGARTLVINARVPDDSKTKEIGVRFRLVNGYMQHWQSISAEILEVKGDRFQDFSVELDPSCWAIFSADGTGDGGPTQPDFSIITSIVLSIGGYERLAPEPTPAEGVIEICSVEIR